MDLPQAYEFTEMTRKTIRLELVPDSSADLPPFLHQEKLNVERSQFYAGILDFKVF